VVSGQNSQRPSSIQTRPQAGKGYDCRQAERRPCSRYPQQHLETGEVEMNKYLIVVEETNTGYSAYSPDLPGCVATGKTKDEVEMTMKEAIEAHLEGLKEEGEPIPAPHTYSILCEIPVSSGNEAPV